MKIVFLDFDGVLNSMWFFRKAWEEGRECRHPFTHVDPKAVRWLNAIVEPSGAKVVISSTWRTLHPLPTLQAILADHGFRGEAIGITPDHSGPDGMKPHQRGDECKAWLDANGTAITHYVALDDGNDFDAIRPNFVHVNPGKGLKPRHVEPALKLLGVEP